MKKTLLYSLAAVATLALASCDGDYDDWADPQSYGPEEAAAKYSVSFAPGAEANDTYTSELQGDGLVELVTISSSNAEVSGYTLKSLTVNGVSMSGTVDGNTIKANASEIEKLVCQQNNSRATVARPITVEANVSINLANGDAVTGSTGEISGTFTPAQTPAVDEKGYFLLGNLNGNGWDATKPVWMTKVSDGVYQATVKTDQDQCWYKIYEGSHFESGNWDEINKGQMGCADNGDEGTTGFVIYSGDPWGEVQTPVIRGEGTYIVTLDMNNLTYSISQPVLYMAGDANGWNQTDYLTSTDGNNFKGFMYLNQNGFKFCTQPNWNGTNYGADFSTAADAANITMTEPEGYYQVEVNLAEKKYTLTAITTIGIIGDAAPDGWKADTDMTYNKTDRAWEIKGLALGDGSIKFRANDDWNINWGGTQDNLTQGGANIDVTAGTYDIKLYAWADGYARCEITKK